MAAESGYMAAEYDDEWGDGGNPEPLACAHSFDELLVLLGAEPTFPIDFLLPSTVPDSLVAELQRRLSDHFTGDGGVPRLRVTRRAQGRLAGRTVVTVVLDSSKAAASFFSTEGGTVLLTVFPGTQAAREVRLTGRPEVTSGWTVMVAVPEGQMAANLSPATLTKILTTTPDVPGPYAYEPLVVFFKPRLLCLAATRLARDGSASATSYALWVKASTEDRSQAPAGFEFPYPRGGTPGLVRLFWSDFPGRGCPKYSCESGSYFACRAHHEDQFVVLHDGRTESVCVYNETRIRPPPARGERGGGGRRDHLGRTAR